MSDKLTPRQVYRKVELEGGLFQAAFGYGLNASDIDASTVEGKELHSLWAKMEKAFEDFAPHLAAVQEVLDEIEVDVLEFD